MAMLWTKLATSCSGLRRIYDSRRVTRRVAAAHALACLLVPAIAFAQPSIAAKRVERVPVLDGEVASDPAWNDVAPATNFDQEQPDEGRPSTERTEVRIVFTSTTLYVGVICYDRDPSGIIVSDARRDAALDQTDSVQIIFDTYRDR